MNPGSSLAADHPADRLDGLDLARFLAFVGMVLVNFKVVMAAEDAGGLAAHLTGLLEGRAAAGFVVLAGIGLGLAAIRSGTPGTITVTLKRAAFLLIAGLLNTLIFDADILHYYAVYFLFGVLCLKLSSTWLVALILLLNAEFVGLMLVFDYDAGWNWQTLTYSDFWTPAGFVRNLIFNGWHPVVPWLGFLLFGFLLSRLDLSARTVKVRMIGAGLGAVVVAELLSFSLTGILAAYDPELALLLTSMLDRIGGGFEAALSLSPAHLSLTPASRHGQAHPLTTHYVGIRVLSRSGLPVETLEQGIATLGSVFGATGATTAS